MCKGKGVADGEGEKVNSYIVAKVSDGIEKK